MCGIGGIWEVPGKWPDEVTGCVPSQVCTVPDSGQIPSASGWNLCLNKFKITKLKEFYQLGDIYSCYNALLMQSIIKNQPTMQGHI